MKLLKFFGSAPMCKEYRKVGTIGWAIESDISQATGVHIWAISPVTKQHSEICTIHDAVTVEVGWIADAFSCKVAAEELEVATRHRFCCCLTDTSCDAESASWRNASSAGICGVGNFKRILSECTSCKHYDHRGDVEYAAKNACKLTSSSERRGVWSIHNGQSHLQ